MGPDGDMILDKDGNPKKVANKDDKTNPYSGPSKTAILITCEDNLTYKKFTLNLGSSFRVFCPARCDKG